MSKNKKGKNKKDDDVLSFLKTFAPQYEQSTTEEKKETSDFWESDAEWEDLEDLSMSDFRRVTIPGETKDKIKELKKIAQSIERKVVKDVDKALNKAIKNKKFKIDYENSLNKSQYLAVTTLEGPILVIAGAGSGKTRTLTYRVSYLLENDIPPEEILLLTFTRKAGHEMVVRTKALLKNNGADKIMRGTFHAFSNHTLRRYANFLNIPHNFTIIDTVDSEDVIDLIRNELQFEKKSKAFPRKSRVQKIISRARNCNKTVEEVIMHEYSGLLEFLDEIEKIANVYLQYKRANNIFDYDDLMEVLRDFLRDNKGFRKKLQNSYKYIMVDEFQDTNVVQKEIIDYIAGGRQNVMVVGDDSQSIYAFRGANFENILRFPETYPDCKVIKLEQNYRSNQDILNFTNDIANSAVLGYQKTLFSQNSNPFKPRVCKFYDREEEAEFIVDKILDLREKDIPLKDMAILYRNTFHAQYIQTELIKRDIPYVVVGVLNLRNANTLKTSCLTCALYTILLMPLLGTAFSNSFPASEK